MPEEGSRYEAIGGELYVTPAPRVPHQKIAMILVESLLPLLEQPGHGSLLFAGEVEFLILPHTQPNRDPKKLARALLDWNATHRENGDLAPYTIDFL